ncbi:MAG TPA: phosphatase PAP2 family protein [Bacteroidales bacterium]
MLKKYLFLLITFAFLCNTVQCQNADISLLREINLNRNRSLDGTFKAITNSAAPISVGLPIGLLGIGIIKGDSALARNAIVIGASVVTSTIVTTIMKNTVKRPRPFETYSDIEKLSDGGSYSFPSGHTSGAFSLATSLSLEYPKWYVIVPSYAWASAVAYSRMDLGVHYPSDVLMGAIVGAGSAYLCHYVNKKLFPKKNILRW